MIKSTAPKACIVGWPVKHSRSPMIHAHWLSQLAIPGTYDFAEVKPEHFTNFVKAMADNGFTGGNVTVPHKEAVFALADHVEASAITIGAVNTLWIENGQIFAANTDASGFLDNLDDRAPGWDQDVRSAVVLGAGGASRAVAFGLRKRGIGRIHLVNRTLGRAEQVAARISDTRAAPVSDLANLLASADLVVNTTSLGMHGQFPLLLDLSAVPAHATVCDIVYVPLETDLLRLARQRGLRTVDGLGMLLHQATHGFEKWFGMRPIVTDALRALVTADILAKI